MNSGEYRVCEICFYDEDNMIQQGVFADRYPHSFTDGSGARKSVEIESSRQSTDSKTTITKAIYRSVQQECRFHCHCRLSSRSTFWRSIVDLRVQLRVSGRWQSGSDNGMRI